MKKTKQKKPRLSGFQRRKLARLKIANGQTVIPAKDPVMSCWWRIRVGALETVDQWRREIAKVYREMRFQMIRNGDWNTPGVRG